MPKAFTNESNAKYQRLFKLYKQAYPDKRGDAVTDEVVKIWRDTLEKGKKRRKVLIVLGTWVLKTREIEKKIPIIFFKAKLSEIAKPFQKCKS